MPTESQKLEAILGALKDFGTAQTIVLTQEGDKYALAAGDPATPFVEAKGAVLGEVIGEAHRKIVETAERSADTAQQAADAARQEALKWAEVLSRARGSAYP